MRCWKSSARSAGVRWVPKGPRLIDIDILLFGSSIVRTPELEIPHPRMAERRFVLVPFNEIAPGVRHPVLEENDRRAARMSPRSQRSPQDCFQAERFASLRMTPKGRHAGHHRQSERLAIQQLLGALFALFLFFFLALVIGHFFFGHLVILAGGEHFLAAVRVATGTRAAALFASKPETLRSGSAIAPLSSKQLADFLKKIVQVVGLEGIGKPFALQ